MPDNAETERRYRLLFETMDQAAHVGELVRDASGKPNDVRIVAVNPAWRALLGVDPATILGRCVSEWAPLEPLWFDMLDRVDRTGCPERLEQRVATLGRWFDVFVLSLGRGEVMIVFTDTTARRASDAEAQASKARQAFLLSLTDALVDVAAPDDAILEAARRVGVHLGVERAVYIQVEGDGFDVTPHYAQGVSPLPTGRHRGGAWTAPLVALLRTGSPLVIDDVRTSPHFDGRLRALFDWVDVGAAVMVPRLRGGELALVLGVSTRGPRAWTAEEVALLTEATERTWAAVERGRAIVALRESERHAMSLLAEARAARADAEAANLAKDEFLAILSHELRTPLASILLYAGALESGSVPPDKAARAVRAISESAESQSHLIEDLLDLSRLTSGRLALTRTPVDVDAAIHAVASMVRPMFEAKRIAFETKASVVLGTALLDGERLRQILANLLTNAAKFTPDGGRVSLAVRRAENTLEIDVEDDGEGISAAFLPHVFEKFRQADMRETRRHLGLGIGLALAKQLVELHGGAITAESAGEGRGTCMRVRIPWIERETAVAEETKATSSLPLEGLHVLVVEDDENTRSAIRWVLEGAGATASEAASAEDAVAIQRGEHPADVVLVDLGLPGASGLDFVRRLGDEARARGRKPAPACAISGHARDADRRKAVDAGFDLYLTKPVAPARLVEAVGDLKDILARA